MAGFKMRGHLYGAQNPVLEKLIIDDDETVTVGDAVFMVSGYVEVCDANERVYGIVVGIESNDGIDLSNQHVTHSGTWTDSSETFTAAADNSTVDMVRAVVCADPFALWYNDSNGTLTVAMLKFFFSLTDEDQIDQGTSSATVGEFQLYKLDPDEDGDASKGIFRIVSWQGDSFEPEA